METKLIPWDEGGGNIVLTFTGDGDGTISVSSDTPNPLFRERVQTLHVDTTTGRPGVMDCEEDLVVRQEAAELVPAYITLDQSYTRDTTHVLIGGDVNAPAIQWIRGNSHCCLGKYTGGGAMSVCRLSDADRTHYHDGTPADLTGAEGDVFMRLPRFFYHAEETEPDVWKIGFFPTQVDADWKEWDGRDLIGVYEGTLRDGLYRSVNGSRPTNNYSHKEFAGMASARGAGYSLVKWKHHSMMAFLFYALYGTADSQSVCGKGGSGIVCGQSDAMGMTDTAADADFVNFWGLENWWGDLSELMEGVTASNRVWTIETDDGQTREAQAGKSNGCIRKVLVGEWLDMTPTDVTGSFGEGYCDYYQQNTGDYVIRRGEQNEADENGVADIRANIDPDNVRYSFIGSRLAFRGDITEVEDIGVFKGLGA